MLFIIPYYCKCTSDNSLINKINNNTFKIWLVSKIIKNTVTEKLIYIDYNKPSECNKHGPQQ